MAVYRSYEIDSGAVSISGTAAIPLLYIAPGSGNDMNILRVKVMIEAASTPAPPSNGSVLFQISAVTGSVGGGASLTPTKLSSSSLIAQTAYKGGTTAITGLTQSATEYWAHAVPFTAGASWEDAMENTGLEINVPASATWCLYSTAASGAGSGCTARAILLTGE